MFIEKGVLDSGWKMTEREAQARVDQGCAIKVKRYRTKQRDFGGMGGWFT